MRTDYIGHEREYQRRKAAGHPGWDTAEVIAGNIERLASLLKSDDVPQSGRVLEMGCGAGDFSLWLAAQGYHVTGVDIAPNAVAWAQEKAIQRGLAADFLINDVRSLENLPNGVFDLVLDGHCLHCIIGEDRGQFLAAARRVLKPAGVLIVMTMCGDPMSAPAARGFDAVTRCQIWGGVALRYFGRSEDILDELRQAGFKIRHVEEHPSKSSDHQHMLLVRASVSHAL